uniref:Integrase catalytic domain-containing protein n=1 Tax=Cannabis sativa TaxID=3483 RepID=A0A803P8J1_CANSA
MEASATGNGGASRSNHDYLPRSNPVSFSHSLSIKLDEHNYLPWKHQVLASIKGSRLQMFLDATRIPPEFLSTDDEINTVNSAYEDWEQQDNLLEALSEYYTALNSANIGLYKTQLRNTKMTGSLNDYLLKIKGIIDLLATIGHKQSSQDHIEAIFNGLPPEYDVFATSVTTRKESYSVAEIEALLMVQSVRIEKNTKALDINKSEANLAHTKSAQGNFANRNYLSNSQMPSGYSRGTPYRYYISFVDAYSRYTWIYMLRTRDEALPTFTKFKTQVELQLGHQIKTLQSDWGGEFGSFTNLLEQCGIVHRLACPHTDEQNGVVERKHRHVVETGLTLLAHAFLPLTFWDEAFRTATFLINRMPTAVIQHITPLQKLFHSPLDYSLLKIFGCLCYPNLRPYNKNKMQYRSTPCVFLGYSMSHKGYKCMSKDKRIYISRDVIFNEFQFPYAESHKRSIDTHFHVHTPGLPPLSSLLHTQNLPPDSPMPQSPAQSTDSTPTISPSPNHTALISSSQLDDITPGLPILPATSSHPMITRIKAGIRKPKAFFASCTPRTVKAALQMPKWNGAMTQEFKALTNNNTWILVRLPPNRKPIGWKWVLRVKHNKDGSVERFKARLVAKGFHQQAGFDFDETFSHVVKPITIRVVLTIAVTRGWSIRKLDVNNAFLNGELQEEIYMQQPPGFVSKEHPDYVCKLNKAIYGLKQAPRAWFEKLSTVLINMGFHSSQADHSLFIKVTTTYCIYILVYVDDILIMGNNANVVNSTISGLNETFALKDLGLVCQFMQTPLQQHWMAVKRILRYIAGTLDYGLHLQPAPDFSIEASCDADWAANPDDRRSTTGYCIYLGGNLVAWNIPTVWCDNQSIVLLAANPVLHARTKHIEIDLYFVRDKVLQHQLQVRHVPAAAQIADCLTKPVSNSKFPDLRSKLTVVSQHTLSLKGAVKGCDN